MVDELQLRLIAGHGGSGAVSFRRERYVPRGGPDGGDGGPGGSILLVADPQLSSLSHLQRKPRWRAENGRPGRGGLKHGRAGADLRLPVPVGTIAWDLDTEQLIGDLHQPGMELVVAKGGAGGQGNFHFKSAHQQVPRTALPGLSGEEKEVRLELRLIADVGLVGPPNAGKSSLLRALTAATPKVGAYPFTTLSPELGVMTVPPTYPPPQEGRNLKEGGPLILADIPGLIAGASQGVGLGLRFLRHIERTRLLLYVIDGSAANPEADLAVVKAELEAYSPALLERPSLTVFNKVDLLAELGNVGARLASPDKNADLWVSALTGEGLPGLREKLAELVASAPPIQTFATAASIPVIHLRQLTQSPQTPQVERIAGGFRIHSQALEQLINHSDLDSPEGLWRFQRQLDRLGISAALETAGALSGDTVIVGKFEFEYQP